MQSNRRCKKITSVLPITQEMVEWIALWATIQHGVLCYIHIAHLANVVTTSILHTWKLHIVHSTHNSNNKSWLINNLTLRTKSWIEKSKQVSLSTLFLTWLAVQNQTVMLQTGISYTILYIKHWFGMLFSAISIYCS